MILFQDVFFLDSWPWKMGHFPDKMNGNPRVTPPMPNLPRDKAILRDNQPRSSPNNASLRSHFPRGGWHWGYSTLRFPSSWAGRLLRINENRNWHQGLFGYLLLHSIPNYPRHEMFTNSYKWTSWWDGKISNQLRLVVWKLFFQWGFLYPILKRCA